MITNFKIYESHNFQKPPTLGEFIICEINNKIFLVKIITESREIEDTFIKNSTNVQILYVLDNFQSNMYYNKQKGYFFHSSMKKYKILWRGNNENDAIKTYNMFVYIDKYNL